MPFSLASIQNYFSSLLLSPLPHNSLEVHRTLLTIYRMHLINLFLSLPAFLLHTAVLTFTTIKEKTCDRPFSLWLIIVSCITALRVVPQCIIITRASFLLSEWITRPVAYETSILVKSFISQLDRILWAISFVWYFVGFQWAYQSITCNLQAPILYQYVTILILFYLAMMGLNCVMCMGSSSIIFLACIIPTDRFVQLFEDRRIGNTPIPIEAIKKMELLEWSPELESDPEISKMCTICLGEYEKGQFLRKLPCGHHFHQPCIDQWFQNNSTCPLRCHFDLCSGKPLSENTSGETIETRMNEFTIVRNNNHTGNILEIIPGHIDFIGAFSVRTDQLDLSDSNSESQRNSVLWQIRPSTAIQ